jgi:hypothetical protein
MQVTIDITEDDVELLQPWLEEFTTELYTNPTDSIVHELLTKIVNQAN